MLHHFPARERTRTQISPRVEHRCFILDRLKKEYALLRSDWKKNDQELQLNLTLSAWIATMNKISSAHPRCVHKTSEFLGILLCTAAYILQKRYPLVFFSSASDIDQSTSNPVCEAIGCFLLVVSAAILRRTQIEMATFDQPHEPGIPTTQLISTGPFHYSRNPTYTAIVLLLQPGLALVFESSWLLILLPVSFGIFWYVMIKPEEEYLQQKV